MTAAFIPAAVSPGGEAPPPGHPSVRRQRPPAPAAADLFASAEGGLVPRSDAEAEGRQRLHESRTLPGEGARPCALPKWLVPAEAASSRDVSRATPPEPDEEDLVFERDPALEEFEDAPEPLNPGVNDLALIEIAARLSPGSGAAYDAFFARRLELTRRHGARADCDVTRPLHAIARSAQDRLIAAMDRLRGSPNAETLALATIALTGAGACLLALHEALAAARAAAAAASALAAERGNL